MIISIPVNPLTKATLAAWSELSTPEAQAWYKAQAIRLYQFIITISIATIALGNTARVFLARKFTKQPIALLSSATDPAPTEQPSEAQEEIVTTLTAQLSDFAQTQPDSAQTQPTTDSEPLETLTLAQLRSKLDQAGIVYHKKARKAHLVNLLLVSA